MNGDRIRRNALALCAALMLGHAAAVYGEPATFEGVVELAQQRSTEPYMPDETEPPLPASAAEWGYNDYRRVRFHSQHSLFADSGAPFQVQPVPRGYIFRRPVRIATISGGEATELQFDRTLFVHRDEKGVDRPVPAELGFAGIRVMRRDDEATKQARLKNPSANAEWWELASFIGASYFRAVGRDHHTGTSARGLGVDIGGQEHFPQFTRFWIVEPTKDAATLTVYALLESDTATGAYRFVITPDEYTTIQVTARLFGRPRLRNINLAPLTSMYLFGESDPNPTPLEGLEGGPGVGGKGAADRPEVHDADGLLIRTGESAWTWRSLTNPRRPSMNQIGVEAVHGFGLIQRDTAFAHYNDTEAWYDRRPSVWVEPAEPWRGGRVDLLLWPAEHEGIDNVAVSYVPPADASGQPPETLDLEYTLRFITGDPVEHRLGRVTSAFVRAGDDGRVNVMIDFTLDPGDNPVTPEQITPEFHASAGKLADLAVRPLDRVDVGAADAGRPVTWRATFTLDPADAESLELTGRLVRDGAPLTETWTATWIRP